MIRNPIQIEPERRYPISFQTALPLCPTSQPLPSTSISIPIHPWPRSAAMGKLAEAMEHPEEILPMIRMYFQTKAALRLPKDPSLSFCYHILTSVSRSFAVVIQQLPPPLRDAVCVFYLVLRALDTVEDDTSIPLSEKLPLLRSFHEKIYDRGFTADYGEKHYKLLLNKFGTCVDVFLSLDENFKGPIADICKRMGNGMADFIEKEVVTTADFDLYCHYVAGLVGIGLGKLFLASKLEKIEFDKQENLANSMGLFLQKTNIIRDYLEDIEELPAPRMFWPKEIWGLYAKKLADLKEPENRSDAIKCLNHMITDALRHVPDCLKYMSYLEDRKVLRFCAIPQVMAIGTLSLCYNNGKVFEGVVKMRRGETSAVFDRMNSMQDVYYHFKHYAGVIGAKCQGLPTGSDPSIKSTLENVEKIEDLCSSGLERLGQPRSQQSKDGDPPIELWVRALVMLFILGYWMYAFGLGNVRASLGVRPDAGNWVVDAMQKLFATLMLAAGTWVGVLGRRI